MAQEKEIILYHYPYSPYARKYVPHHYYSEIQPSNPPNRVIWYLNLRGIPYTQCARLPKPTIQEPPS